MIKSLSARNHDLSDVNHQKEILNGELFENGHYPAFKKRLNEDGVDKIIPAKLDILQVNVGYMCNQTCKHCHVDAGPDRKEIMSQQTMRQCLNFLEKHSIQTLDITGGAPEMNPNFFWLVEEASKSGVKEIIVRSNLTILVSNKKYDTAPDFFRKHKLRVVSSLPFYNADKTDRQRGEGVFKKSIDALIRLNEAGYGKEGDLILDLVYNPSGAFLPASQVSLEKEFKKALSEEFGISFNHLLTITNLPISRFLEFLIRTDNYEEYMDTLINAFNPSTLMGLMCTNTLSVGWDGQVYDCDFNQMLQLPAKVARPFIADIDFNSLKNREIVTGQHCYGCTAGAGSSCQGSVI